MKCAICDEFWIDYRQLRTNIFLIKNRPTKPNHENVWLLIYRESNPVWFKAIDDEQLFILKSRNNFTCELWNLVESSQLQTSFHIPNRSINSLQKQKIPFSKYFASIINKHFKSKLYSPITYECHKQMNRM